MAINYQKVGWDTTKYFNPTNMNQMDNGIKAACDKADANEAAIADVNNKLGNTDISAIGDGTLTGGLDALNSNLTNIKSSRLSIYNISSYNLNVTKKLLNVVNVTFDGVVGNDISAWGNMFEIPSGYIPSNNQTVIGYNVTKAKFIYGLALSNGNIQFSEAVSIKDNIRFSVTYLADT